ncbi:MAG: hypothetical protein KZQ85_04235 [Candidatus Thiodiazotropha sp. (ex Myrtea sp. 'scaly one' KF741663)]|nr:hypothetical protein [Candidatus Thiodiazotropha sp. (ex Myrtea sp. 'scaly one' KF741663)]
MAILTARLDTMEDKTNKALRQSATAKVDAATALFISQEKYFAVALPGLNHQ